MLLKFYLSGACLYIIDERIDSVTEELKINQKRVEEKVDQNMSNKNLNKQEEI